MHRSPLRVALPLIAALVVLITAATASAAAWQRLSPRGQSSTSQISLLRNGDSSLTAIGLFAGSLPGGRDIVRVPVSRSGVVGAAQVLLSGADWTILENPAAIDQSGQQLVVFGGQTTTGDDSLWTYNLGSAALTRYTGSGGGPTAAASGTSAAATPAGGIAAWASTFGLGTLPLANPAALPASQPLTGCCAYNQSFAALADGRLFVVYDSNEDDASGRWFQQIDPASGAAISARARVPKSNIGRQYDFPVESRASVAVVGSTAYTAWAQGYPAKLRVALWRQGTATPKRWNPGYRVGVAGVAATRSGSLWVYWTQASTGAVYAVRSNDARTVWSRPKLVGRPSRTLETTYKLVGNADRADGRLDLAAAMARYAGNPTWYHTLVPR